MISVNQAINLVKKHCKPMLRKATKPVEKANGYKLFSDVYSNINMPPFRQSAMDGYALNMHNQNTYKLIGEVKAGDNKQPVLEAGEAIRIFTGAPVPETANAVVMQEKVAAKANEITVTTSVFEHENIRPIGEQVKSGALALEKNTKITPAAIGYLSSLGVTTIDVFKKPNIAIITTGNELVNPGEPLEYGCIYESNSKMLLSALYSLKFYDVTILKVNDDFDNTYNTLREAITNHDLVLITGGISVGDYDFVGDALTKLNITQHFYKVMQKPGKPLFFGTKNHTNIFALPGNPAAALTCFYKYVYTALQIMMNNERVDLPTVSAKSETAFVKKGDRPQFLKAIYNNDNVTILEGQSSAMQHTFALANALVFVPQEVSEIKIGDTVETMLLPV
ncbi:molybdenum cofactor biosynthesis protein [Tamlana nanhaiensis]|uniref:Molybdopterin molybdenumtransferase n=1 Tax=Neotamlana nanhaiensis TaxID=1382798 RepID=A0A0D7W4F7_9FLAO|nr:gephyrin-like molybdotransferase Glp [Tamlana nanhaiensis]KJD33904.1 molybdenum cofactor biosynthesis protein [Tamlana nanhaiensis]